MCDNSHPPTIGDRGSHGVFHSETSSPGCIAIQITGHCVRYGRDGDQFPPSLSAMYSRPDLRRFTRCRYLHRSVGTSRAVAAISPVAAHAQRARGTDGSANPC